MRITRLLVGAALALAVLAPTGCVSVPDSGPVRVGPEAESEVVIVTGMSGAGRTRAAAALADHGWYVVDNIPPQMLGGLVAMVGSSPDEFARYIRSELAKWGKVARDAGIKPE